MHGMSAHWPRVLEIVCAHVELDASKGYVKSRAWAFSSCARTSHGVTASRNLQQSSQICHGGGHVDAGTCAVRGNCSATFPPARVPLRPMCARQLAIYRDAEWCHGATKTLPLSFQLNLRTIALDVASHVQFCVISLYTGRHCPSCEGRRHVTTNRMTNTVGTSVYGRETIALCTDKETETQDRQGRHCTRCTQDAPVTAPRT